MDSVLDLDLRARGVICKVYPGSHINAIIYLYFLSMFCLCDIISFTSDGYRQGLAFSGDKGASTQLDPIQAVVVALVDTLCIGEGESDGQGEGRQGLAHRAIGADQTQLEGTPRVLLWCGAGDVKTVAFKDGTSRCLSGRVVPVVRSQEFHCDQSKMN